MNLQKYNKIIYHQIQLNVLKNGEYNSWRNHENVNYTYPLESLFSKDQIEKEIY